MAGLGRRDGARGAVSPRGGGGAPSARARPRRIPRSTPRRSELRASTGGFAASPGASGGRREAARHGSRPGRAPRRPGAAGGGQAVGGGPCRGAAGACAISWKLGTGRAEARACGSSSCAPVPRSASATAPRRRALARAEERTGRLAGTDDALERDLLRALWDRARVRTEQATRAAPRRLPRGRGGAQRPGRGRVRPRPDGRPLAHRRLRERRGGRAASLARALRTREHGRRRDAQPSREHPVTRRGGGGERDLPACAPPRAPPRGAPAGDARTEQPRSHRRAARPPARGARVAPGGARARPPVGRSPPDGGGRGERGRDARPSRELRGGPRRPRAAEPLARLLTARAWLSTWRWFAARARGRG